MKTIFKTVLIILTSFACMTSCKSVNEPTDTTITDTATNSSITSSGVITGKIENYTTASTMSLSYNNYKVLVSNSGTFTINATYPTLLKVSDTNLKSISSDTLASVYFEDGPTIYATVNSKIGRLFRTNMTVNQDSISWKVGDVYCTVYAYTNKPVTVKGTVDSYNYNYDLNLKTGWNEIAVIITSKSSNLLWTSTLPSNLKWYYLLI